MSEEPDSSAILELLDDDESLLRAAQDGISIEAKPFATLGESLGMSEDEVISRLLELQRVGAIRRFAATIGHRALGITANAMIVWSVRQDDLFRAGSIMASFDEVTHCYERASCPQWPYNLYTMVHARSRAECEKVAEKISSACMVNDYEILWSELEYKKTSARI
jgi:DNA-binding Lrp family transcriptional regulator